MRDFDFTAFSREVHANAIAKGWWEEERTQEELAMLIISEICEALEEYRKGMPMVYHLCNEPDQHKGKVCERESDCYMRRVGCSPTQCHKRDAKPEGIAVELIDAVLRVLDICGKTEADLRFAQESNIGVLSSIKLDESIKTLPEIEYMLCKNVFMACEIGLLKPRGATFLFGIVALPIMDWLILNGEDAFGILRDKHEYNKTRTYRHGGKAL